MSSLNPWFSILCLLFCLYFQLFVYNVSCLLTITAVCLLFMSAVYLLFRIFKQNIDFCKVFCQNVEFKLVIFSLLFTFVSCLFVYLFIYQLFVYFFVSWLFTLSAVCLLFRIFKQNIDFCKVFCQNGDFKILFWLLFCLHFQLIVYNFQM